MRVFLLFLAMLLSPRSVYSQNKEFLNEKENEIVFSDPISDEGGYLSLIYNGKTTTILDIGVIRTFVQNLKPVGDDCDCLFFYKVFHSNFDNDENVLKKRFHLVISDRKVSNIDFVWSFSAMEFGESDFDQDICECRVSLNNLSSISSYFNNNRLDWIPERSIHNSFPMYFQKGDIVLIRSKCRIIKVTLISLMRYSEKYRDEYATWQRLDVKIEEYLSVDEVDIKSQVGHIKSIYSVNEDLILNLKGDLIRWEILPQCRGKMRFASSDENNRYFIKNYGFRVVIGKEIPKVGFYRNLREYYRYINLDGFIRKQLEDSG